MSRQPAVQVAVAGAGLIGRRHISSVASGDATELAAVIDPAPAAGLAGHLGVPWYATLPEALAAGGLDGVVLATPNRLHVQGGLECVEAGVPVLVEKPIGPDVESATRLVEAAEAAGVPLLTGHHRQHSPIMVRAREVIATGTLGPVVAVMGSAAFYKPDGYFEAPNAWRRQAGGGPILLNLIHDVNALMSLVGPIVAVQAIASNATRGFEVEDTAAIILRFATGALGTFLLSDTAACARSWEQTSGENPDFPSYPDDDAYVIAGSRGSLGVPSMRLKVFEGARSWYEPYRVTRLQVETADPLAVQIQHFAAVIRGEAQPLVSGRDGLDALRVTEAVAEAARRGTVVPTGVST